MRKLKVEAQTRRPTTPGSEGHCSPRLEANPPLGCRHSRGRQDNAWPGKDLTAAYSQTERQPPTKEQGAVRVK